MFCYILACEAYVSGGKGHLIEMQRTVPDTGDNFVKGVGQRCE